MQKDACVSLPSNELHNVIDPPADDINDVIILLAHTNDSIVGPDGLGLFRRPSRDKAHNFRVFILRLEQGADALEGQAHVDVEVFARDRGKVLCVWIVSFGERIHKELIDVVLVSFLKSA